MPVVNKRRLIEARRSWEHYRREPFNEEKNLKYFASQYRIALKRDGADAARHNLTETLRAVGAGADTDRPWALDVLVDWVIYELVPRWSHLVHVSFFVRGEFKYGENYELNETDLSDIKKDISDKYEDVDVLDVDICVKGVNRLLPDVKDGKSLRLRDMLKMVQYNNWRNLSLDVIFYLRREATKTVVAGAAAGGAGGSAAAGAAGGVPAPVVVGEKRKHDAIVISDD